MDTEEKVPQEGQPDGAAGAEEKADVARSQKLVSAVYEFADILVSALLVIFLIFTFFIPFGRRGGNLHGAHLAGE